MRALGGCGKIVILCMPAYLSPAPSSEWCSLGYFVHFNPGLGANQLTRVGGKARRVVSTREQPQPVS